MGSACVLVVSLSFSLSLSLSLSLDAGVVGVCVCWCREQIGRCVRAVALARACSRVLLSLSDTAHVC